MHEALGSRCWARVTAMFSVKLALYGARQTVSRSLQDVRRVIFGGLQCEWELSAGMCALVYGPWKAFLRENELD